MNKPTHDANSAGVQPVRSARRRARARSSRPDTSPSTSSACRGLSPSRCATTAGTSAARPSGTSPRRCRRPPPRATRRATRRSDDDAGSGLDLNARFPRVAVDLGRDLLAHLPAQFVRATLILRHVLVARRHGPLQVAQRAGLHLLDRTVARSLVLGLVVRPLLRGHARLVRRAVDRLEPRDVLGLGDLLLGGQHAVEDLPDVVRDAQVAPGHEGLERLVDLL